ncbi:hypothetical protein FGIG_03237, partial [Fasciola gigantica]
MVTSIVAQLNSRWLARQSTQEPAARRVSGCPPFVWNASDTYGNYVQ